MDEVNENPGLFVNRDRDNWEVKQVESTPYMYGAINKVSGEKFFGTLADFEASLGSTE